MSFYFKNVTVGIVTTGYFKWGPLGHCPIDPQVYQWTPYAKEYNIIN